jgi:hypothetical protein
VGQGNGEHCHWWSMSPDAIPIACLFDCRTSSGEGERHCTASGTRKTTSCQGAWIVVLARPISSHTHSTESRLE